LNRDQEDYQGAFPWPQAFQPFWERLHAWALQGMNICSGDGSIDPGEIWVLQHVSKQTPKSATSVVLDVGANTGLYSAAVLRNFQANLRLYSLNPLIRVMNC